MIRAACTIALLVLSAALAAQESPYARWKKGPPADPSWFPIGVWLQEPKLAPAYQEIGINLYVGLWDGPTKQQLQELHKHRMPVIAAQNYTATTSQRRNRIVGWQHVDEPDNAQPRKGLGYGPPIPPAEILKRYRRMKDRDPTRPIFLNLGQGVANDNWHGRGKRSGKQEDYPKYVQATDIVAFDIYPVTHPDSRIRGKLELVAKGVERLVRWSRGRQVVWNFIEASRVHGDTAPTTAQVRAEVWMSLVHGSRGIVYFCHEWKPRFQAAALLHDPKLKAGVAAINKQILALAPVLNSPTIDKAVAVRSKNKKVPVATMLKRHGGATWLFAVCMRDHETRATIRVRGLKDSGHSMATVLGEARAIPLKNGRFEDDFGPYAVHLYKIEKKKAAKSAAKKEP